MPPHSHRHRHTRTHTAHTLSPHITTTCCSLGLSGSIFGVTVAASSRTRGAFRFSGGQQGNCRSQLLALTLASYSEPLPTNCISLLSCCSRIPHRFSSLEGGRCCWCNCGCKRQGEGRGGQQGDFHFHFLFHFLFLFLFLLRPPLADVLALHFVRAVASPPPPKLTITRRLHSSLE
jgi:hypothetical protein